MTLLRCRLMMLFPAIRLPAAVCLVMMAMGVAPVAGVEPLEHRWVYLQINLQVPEEAVRAEELLRRAAAAGYNGLVYADYKLNVLDRVTEGYRKNVASLKRLARELNVELIPCVAPFGYSSGILASRPDLAEGLPARDVRFEVQQDRLVPIVDKRLTGLRGEFEEHAGHEFAGWSFQDVPGAGTFADEEIFHSGKCSLRIVAGGSQDREPESKPRSGGNRRVSKTLTVRPYHQYHASVWMRTRDFENASSVRLFAMGESTGQMLSFQNLGVARDQDWTEHHIIFNSLEATRIHLYCGAWGIGGGTLWMDDLKLEEAPLVNLVQRDGAPLQIKTGDGKLLVEGKDYQPVQDSLFHELALKGEFEVYHRPPTIQLMPGSRLKNGQSLLVSYFHVVSIYERQVAASLSAEGCFEWLTEQLRQVDELLGSSHYFLSHDEIRVAHWGADDMASGKSAGQQLAENLERCIKIVRARQPAARLCVWSDMFDPYHNAQESFYLVRGSLKDSWTTLPPDMLIINWNLHDTVASTKFFAERGHKQILAGFYDGSVEQIRHSLEATRQQNVTGVMYTTWRNDFSQLEEFAKLAWGTP